MKSFATVLVLAYAALAFTSNVTVSGTAAKGQEKPDLKPLPTLKLTDFAGKPVTQEEFNGKAYIVDFWATWCGPCIVEIPHFNRLQEKYADKGLKVIGVTLASGEAKEVKPLVDRHKMKYTVLMGDDEQAFDLQIMGFPTTCVVTQDWKVYKRYTGLGAKKAEQIEADILHLLNN